MTKETIDIVTGNKLIYAFMGGLWKAVENPDRNGMTSYVGEFVSEEECQKFCNTINAKKQGSPRLMKHAIPHPVNTGFSGELKYHTSWDWLMPVWVKWQEWYLEYTKKVNPPHKWRSIICDKLNKGDILGVHKYLVEGIQWYNQNKK